MRYALMQGEAFRDEYGDWTAEITDPLAFAGEMAALLNDTEVQNEILGPTFDALAARIAEGGAESVRLEETPGWRAC